MLLLTPWAAQALNLLSVAWIFACPFVAWRLRARISPQADRWQGGALLACLPVLVAVPGNWVRPFEMLWFSGALFATWCAAFALNRIRFLGGLGATLAIPGSVVALFLFFSGPARINRIELGNSLACENLVGGNVEFYVVSGEPWWPVNRILLKREFAYTDGEERFGTCRIESPRKLTAEIPGETVSVALD